MLNHALQRAVDEGTGRAAKIGRPVAGKTGTTTDNIDAWFVGYVPQLATAVWVGFEPKRPMFSVRNRAVTGGSLPAEIFGQLMATALAGLPPAPLPTASPDSLELQLVGNATTQPPVPAPAPPVGDPAPPVPDPPPAGAPLAPEDAPGPATSAPPPRRNPPNSFAPPAPTSTTTRPPATTTPMASTTSTAPPGQPTTTTTSRR